MTITDKVGEWMNRHFEGRSPPIDEDDPATFLFRERLRVAAARARLRNGDVAGARRLLVLAVHQWTRSEHDYDLAIAALADVHSAARNARAVEVCRLYLRDGFALRSFAVDDKSMARAAVVRGDEAEAGRCYLRAGWSAHAAIAFERAGLWASADAAWAGFEADCRRRGDAYGEGIALAGRAMACARGDRRVEARDLARRARAALAEASVAAATSGDTPAASEPWEIASEMCLAVDDADGAAAALESSADVLAEDGIVHFAVQRYLHAARLHRTRGRSDEAARVLTAAVEIAVADRAPWSGELRTRAGSAWIDAAREELRRGRGSAARGLLEKAFHTNPPVILAAGVEQLLRQAMANESPAVIDARIASLHLAAASWPRPWLPAGEPLPGHVESPPNTYGIRVDDALAIETDADVFDVACDLLLAPGLPSYVRRRTLAVALTAVNPPAKLPDDASTSMDADLRANMHPALLAYGLGFVQVYPVIAPLAKLARHESAGVRMMAQGAFAKLFFPAALIHVVAGLNDPEPEVRAAARATIRASRYPHATSLLIRGHRAARDPEDRAAFLDALMHIDTTRARAYTHDLLARRDSEAVSANRRAHAEHAARRELEVAFPGLPPRISAGRRLLRRLARRRPPS